MAASRKGRTGRKRGNNEGTIVERPDGRWAGAVTLPDGKRKWVYGKTRAEVAGKLTEVLSAARNGEGVSSGKETVGAYLAGWLEIVRPSVKPRTYESYALNVRRLEPLIGKVKLSALTPDHLERAYAALLDRGVPRTDDDRTTEQPLSRRSVEQAHTVLHTALERAVSPKRRLIAVNPADYATVPRPPRREMQTLTVEQLDRLFDANTGDRHLPLWIVLATTGLRLGEATGLRWQDLDLAGGRLTVRRALQRQRGKGLVIVEPKSAQSRRTVHLSHFTLAALRDHRSRQLEERLASGPEWRDHDLVFCTVNGRLFDPSRLSGLFHRALARAALPRLRIHDLRHTCATILLQRGVHPKLVQEMLGHSTITLTLNTYSHVIPAMHGEAARHMDAIFTMAVRAAAP